MKSIRIENSIKLKTAFKCLLNKTKWKVHLTKLISSTIGRVVTAQIVTVIALSKMTNKHNIIKTLSLRMVI